MNESEKVEYELTEKIRVVSAQSFSFPIWITDNVVVPVRVGESSTCHLICIMNYHIAGNFRWVQIFSIFVNKPASAKMKKCTKIRGQD